MSLAMVKTEAMTQIDVFFHQFVCTDFNAFKSLLEV